MRGHREQSGELTVKERSIPADAGAPATDLGIAIQKKVYPRGCGGTRHSLLSHSST